MWEEDEDGFVNLETDTLAPTTLMGQCKGYGWVNQEQELPNNPVFYHFFFSNIYRFQYEISL